MPPMKPKLWIAGLLLLGAVSLMGTGAMADWRKT